METYHRDAERRDDVYEDEDRRSARFDIYGCGMSWAETHLWWELLEQLLKLGGALATGV